MLRWSMDEHCLYDPQAELRRLYCDNCGIELEIGEDDIYEDDHNFALCESCLHRLYRKKWC